MTQRHYLITALLVLIMAAVAYGMGQWAQQLNPDGIIPNTPVVVQDETTTPPPIEADTTPEVRNAFTFGASMGLLSVGLLYCLLAAGLLLYANSKGSTDRRLVYVVTGLAVTAFALSYLIDDYFY